VRWSATLGAWARREAVLVAALTLAAAAAALATPLNVPWLFVVGAVVAALGAVARGAIAVVRARLEGRRERAEFTRRLRVAVGPVYEIDPTAVGIDPAAQAVLAGGPVPAYVQRGVDALLTQSVTAAVQGRGPWLVVVMGASKVGKSRALFEALRRCTGNDEVQLVAPTDGEALRALLLPGQDLRLRKMPAVLWLDDLEPFLNQGVTLQTLREWRASGPGRIVAATYGGKGNELAASSTTSGLSTIAEVVLQHAQQISLGQTTTLELAPLRAQVPEIEFDAVQRHGLAPYLVAGPALERKLITGRHALLEMPCPEGVAVVYAAIDWARCGRTDPISPRPCASCGPPTCPPGCPTTTTISKVG
jgi:hypothetical protein